MLKEWLFKNLLVVLVLSIVVTPAMVMAAESSSASANLSVPVFTAVDVTGAPVTIDWTAGGLFGPPGNLDTRGSQSGVATTLTGTIESHNSDFADGAPWQNTYITTSQGIAPNTVAGSADTHSSLTPADTPLLIGGVPQLDPITGAPLFVTLPADRLFASSNVALGTSLMSGSVFAQALLGGQFTVLTAATLSVSLTYQLLLDLISSGDFNYADAIAALYLYDFYASDPIDPQQSLLYASAVSPPLAQLMNGAGTFNSGLVTGPLTLSWNLVPGVVYDFEASATVNADAAVPEPISMVLLGTGMLGLAILRKRSA
jgi:hypothetical protein